MDTCVFLSTSFALARRALYLVAVRPSHVRAKRGFLGSGSFRFGLWRECHNFVRRRRSLGLVCSSIVRWIMRQLLDLILTVGCGRVLD